MERGAATIPIRSVRLLRQALALPDALRWHAAAFAGGAVALTLLNVMRSPDRLWFWAPLLVWCALLALHGWGIARAANPQPEPAAAASTALPSVAPMLMPVPASATPASTPVASPPARLPAAAELAALRLSLDPWATAALASANAGHEELPESVLALWRLEPDPPAAPPDAASPARPAVDLHALSWI